ncbi:MAG TPA: hypothetical protein VGL29_14795 [Blastocatellia bacterium]
MGPNEKRWPWQDWIVASFLFLATAAVVVWQNSRLTILWDLSYILENSYRMALGDVPYRDFPFPYAPLTFLIQAALIKLTGRVLWHHIAYCAVTGGLASVVTWRIVLRSLWESNHARWLAFVLSLPLMVLGIYCIYPHPFYDPDCTLAILIGALLLQRLERKGSAQALLTGMLLVIPAFIKQNIGLAFLGAAVGALVLLMVIAVRERRSARRFVFALAGALLGLACALLVIQLTAGLQNYWRWTIQFAASRRMPHLADMLQGYWDKTVLWSIIPFAAGSCMLWLNRSGSRAMGLLSTLLMSAPFAWPAIYLLVERDTSERAARLLALWPLVMVVSLVLAIVSVRRRSGMSSVMPFLLLATVQGAFLSQQLWGSTYAIWPLWIILAADVIAAIGSLARARAAWSRLPLAFVVGASTIIAGAAYAWSHERLDYANLSDGAIAHSRLPELKGLSMRGDWIASFEELVDYTEREIPRDEGILMLPGEDLFYYTTGRRPRFPVLMFDYTVDPYTADEIRELARERNIRWLIVKQELQIEEDSVKQFKDELTELLEEDFEQVESLDNYEVYRRREPQPEEDEN